MFCALERDIVSTFPSNWLSGSYGLHVEAKLGCSRSQGVENKRWTSRVPTLNIR